MVVCAPQSSMNPLHALGKTNFVQHSADRSGVLTLHYSRSRIWTPARCQIMSKDTCKRYTTTFSRLLDCVCTHLCLLQISAIKVLLNDLKGGLSKVNTEILKAAGVDANSAFAHRQFGDLMMTFHEHAKSTFADAEVTLHLFAPSKPPASHQPATDTYHDVHQGYNVHVHDSSRLMVLTFPSQAVDAR